MNYNNDVEDPQAATVGITREQKIGDNVDGYNEHDAAVADALEHRQTIREAFFMYKKAIFWSMLLSASLIMEGYDVVVVSKWFDHLLMDLMMLSPLEFQFLISPPPDWIFLRSK